MKIRVYNQHNKEYILTESELSVLKYFFDNRFSKRVEPNNQMWFNVVMDYLSKEGYTIVAKDSDREVFNKPGEKK